MHNGAFALQAHHDTALAGSEGACWALLTSPSAQILSVIQFDSHESTQQDWAEHLDAIWCPTALQRTISSTISPAPLGEALLPWYIQPS